MSAATTPEATPTGERRRCPVDLDLVDPDTFLSGTPVEAFARMRAEAPVFWHEQPNGPGGGFWAVTRAADIREVSRTPEVFSSYEYGSLLQASAQSSGDLDTTRLLLINMDAPDHTRQRSIVQRIFTPRKIRALEPHLRAFAEEIVDRALAKGEGDFVKDVAAELPLLAICELMGIPAGDRDKIFDLSNRLIGSEDPEFRTSPEDAQAASAEMYMYANELAEQRKQEPRADIITELLKAEVDGHALSVSEFDIFFLLLAVAGNETTRNAITHGMKAFFDHPDQWEVFKRERPETTADEIIRWATPVMQFQRTAKSDHVLGGQQIKAGDRVVMFYSAASRDSSLAAEPDRFDITRASDHVAFGGGGPHFCLGANLARAEVHIIFDVIADRMPDLRPIGDVRPLRSMFINGIKGFPVRYAPSA